MGEFNPEFNPDRLPEAALHVAAGDTVSQLAARLEVPLSQARRLWCRARHHSQRRRLARVRERLKDCSVDEWYQLHQEREHLERQLGEVEVSHE